MFLRKVVSMLGLVGLMYSTGASAENVISKKDADGIFSMKMAEWELTAPRYAYPNWEMKLRKFDTGSMVAAFDNSNGYGLSIQPIYLDAKSFPLSLIVGSFYPKGTITEDFTTIQKQIESDSEKDLGNSYKVSAKYLIVSPNTEEVELTLTRKGHK